MDIYSNPLANKVATEGSVDGKMMVTRLLSVRYEDGIYAYYEGAEFPQKGLSPVEVMTNVNIVKALFIALFSLRPNLKSLLFNFNRVGCRVIEQYFIKDEYRTAGGRELEGIVYRFIFSLTSNDNIALNFSKIFSHLIEYDNAYRLRFIDIGSETSKELLLKKPIREIRRLLKVLAEREVLLGKSVVDKFSSVVFVLSVALLIPRFRKAFRYAIDGSDWNNMGYDDIDRYWASLRIDYNFMGLSSKDRLNILEDNGFSLPKQIEINT